MIESWAERRGVYDTDIAKVLIITSVSFPPPRLPLVKNSSFDFRVKLVRREIIDRFLPETFVIRICFGATPRVRENPFVPTFVEFYFYEPASSRSPVAGNYYLPIRFVTNAKRKFREPLTINCMTIFSYDYMTYMTI